MERAVRPRYGPLHVTFQPLMRDVPAARSALIARKIVVSCAGWGWA